MKEKINESSSVSSASGESKEAALTRLPHGAGASAFSCSELTPEKISKAIVQVLTQEFREGMGYENRVIYEEEALILASLVIQKLNLS